MAFYRMYNSAVQFRTVHKHDGMRFIIHANEDCGHNRGHIHIESGDSEIVIDLQSFKVLKKSGKVNSHKIKMAQKFVKENQEMFIKYWNEFSNGIKIPA